jgi:hypothetical protein
MFSFFRKREKKKNKEKILPKVKSVLCIPGAWKDRIEIMERIVESSSGEYIFAGIALLNTKTNESCQLFMEPKKETLLNTFAIAGLVNSVSEPFLNQIEKHEQIVYLISETGSFEKAKALAYAGNAILNAGGFGIYVESTGKAFEKEQWQELLENFEEQSLYEMFVHDSIENKDGKVFSCGMHHLGLKDCIIYGQSSEEANTALKIWGSYQIIDKPIIKKGQTFGFPPIIPTFRIEEEKNPPYKEHELFHNPFGTWKLTKLK